MSLRHGRAARLLFVGGGDAHALGWHEIEGFARRVIDDPVTDDLSVLVRHGREANDCADGDVGVVVAVEDEFNVHDPVIPTVPEDWQGKDDTCKVSRAVRLAFYANLAAIALYRAVTGVGRDPSPHPRSSPASALRAIFRAFSAPLGGSMYGRGGSGRNLRCGDRLGEVDQACPASGRIGNVPCSQAQWN